MQINELQVISFDKFSFKNSQLVDYDENIRIHLNFVIHYLQKKSIIEESKVKEDLEQNIGNQALVTTKEFIDHQMRLIN
jgi:hypothetical protein